MTERNEVDMALSRAAAERVREMRTRASITWRALPEAFGYSLDPAKCGIILGEPARPWLLA